MPNVYEPVEHRCLYDNKFDPDINKSGDQIPLGTVWKCPDCGRLWERQVIGGRYQAAKWFKVSKWHVLRKQRKQKRIAARDARRKQRNSGQPES